MTRTLTGAMVTAAESASQSPIILVEALFDSGALRLWTGYGTLTWDAKAWTGSGDLLRIAPAEETSRVVAAGATFMLSGVSSDLIAIALAEDYQGRTVNMWLGMLSGESVIADPVLVFAGLLDVMEIDEGGQTATITVSAESRLAILEKPPGGYYTDEDQKARYPTDRGLEFVADLQDKEVIWR